MENQPKEKLIEMRKLRGLTQKDMAERLNMEVSGYTKRENGQRRIRLNLWAECAEILKCKIEDIYEEDEKQSNTFNNNATVKYGANNMYLTVHEAVIDKQLNYIQKLEQEIIELKKMIMKE